jgi:hypothetical protein
MWVGPRYLINTQVSHPQFLSKPVKCSRPEKFFKVKSIDTMVKFKKVPWTQEKAQRKCNSLRSKYILKSASLYLLAPQKNAPKKYFTLKNFFWPAEPKALYLFEGAKLELVFRN